MKLYTINWILSRLLSIGLLAFVILFQPEIRKALEQIGRGARIDVRRDEAQADADKLIDEIIRCLLNLSRRRVGALIVFARNMQLEDYVKTGTSIDAQVSEQLLRNIFFPKAALHDGAMIIRDGRVTAAGCVLPLSDSNRLSADLGTRHRAGVGMSESSDAVVVIVSEETGTISVAVGGMLKRHLAPQTLERLLTNELCREEAPAQENLAVRLRQKLQKKGKGEQNEK